MQKLHLLIEFLQLILVDIILKRLTRLWAQITSLDIMQNQDGCTLILLRQGGECLVQLLQGCLCLFATRAFCIELLDKLLELRVDILCINLTSTNLCDVSIFRIVKIPFLTTLYRSKEFTIACQQYLIGSLIKLHLYSSDAGFMIKLIFALLPSKSLQFGRLYHAGHHTKVLGKHIPIDTTFRQAFKVHDVVAMEDVTNMQEQPVNRFQVLLQLVHKHTQRLIYVELQRILDVLFHRIGEGVIDDSAPGLLMLVEDTIGT